MYTAPNGTFAVTGTTISSPAYDAFIADLSTELTNSLNVQGTAAMLAALNFGSQKGINLAAPVAGTDAANKTYVDNAFPAGLIMFFGYSTAPTGWLICNGASLSTTTYAKLFSAIAYQYGGAGANFLLPDLRGVVPRGWDNGRGLDAGRTFGSYQADTLASHAHGLTDPGHAHSVSDLGHAHGVSDPGHAHSVNDPGHIHTYSFRSQGGGTGSVAGVGWGPQTLNVGAAFTGISLNANVTGIGVSANVTGVGVGANVTGITVQAAGTTETRGKNVALLPIIKF